ncbi:hypothetical protein GCG54_00011234 [Colletotrichum gloeosporioides]|uniref:Uncharacterized protein n=1 Tax=Colletotrichum gloeosporioides TaxID=474922 RepID=A0A8H4CRZ8_COLGL|nr:uncharacterized protein GCG54_00011234 [Colletotrichum gloeosporioides]KAF3809038.1 hypothetical protein GCG54_00011234 [Colletotrichum gloeosporioides]
MSSTPCACCVRFVSLKKHENPEPSSKNDAARPSEDHRTGYLSLDTSQSFDFGLWTASTESRQVICRHVLKHASREELGRHAMLSRMHINGEDIVFDVFNQVITCFRVPQDEHLNVDEALEVITYTSKGTRSKFTQFVAFECDESWELDRTLGDDPHVLQKMMKMPGSRGACLRTIDKIIRERLHCHIHLFIGNKDACAEPLNEWQLQSLGNWRPRSFHSDGYNFTSPSKFDDSLSLLPHDQIAIWNIATSFIDLLDSKGKDHWDPNGAYEKKLLELYEPNFSNYEEYWACEKAVSPSKLVSEYICERIPTPNVG